MFDCLIKVLWIFDHLGLKYLNSIAVYKMKKDWKLILDITLEIVKIIVMIIK